MIDKIKIEKSFIESLLLECWSFQTRSLYIKDHPARGQCDVTAILIYDYFGGEIIKTFINEQPHYSFLFSRSSQKPGFL
ncbi:MAG: hypothetical protein AAF349_17715 [Cyanobacteria bacterium P01_A01_bin.68]